MKNNILALVFACLTFLYGNIYHVMGPWMLIFGVCFIFWILQIKLFYNISSKSKYWTILYSLLNISSVYWMLLLDEYHNEGSGAQSNNGLYLYFIACGILVLFAKFLNKSNVAKFLIAIIFILAGYGVVNYYSIKAKSVCPPEKPLMDEYGRCYDCSDTRALDNIGNCSVCPNRTTFGDFKKCAMTQCPSDYPLRNSAFGDCYACDDTNSLFYVKNCSTCPQRKYSESNSCVLATCPREKPLRDKFGICYPCDSLKALGNIMNCDVCENRFSGEKGCIWKDCPSDFPLKDVYGECHSCDELSAVFVANKQTCEVCKDKRKIFGTDETGTHREFCSLIYCPDGTQRETGYYITGRCLKKK